ncbi:MAG: lipoate--protein ligase family protein [Candidatus Fermentithermobacillus carboniphilus]|uniref:Lipoate--protein ligase family protein n=1 Tax=Candidatus Fermentithermobacillus carboniphilus TaxID=3085328 RepID=A0AAT9LFK9_9FIRM|nr:MAG: lipoate--protein ligase family protein [Candidatus Fermentithermobacillus carboniphilus]
MKRVRESLAGNRERERRRKTVRVRLLIHGSMRGKFNMAVDEAIQRACQRGEVPPTLRFYAWDPACLSLGYFQDVEREVNLDGLREIGADLVRRPTGGKAVLHDDELTYSVVIPEKDLKGSVLETYQELSKALVRGIVSLGIPAELAALEHGVTMRDQRFRQAACFSAPSWYEVVASGKKIVGSAQVRKNGVILQHGSIPFVFDSRKVTKCLKTSSPEHAAKIESMLSRKAAGLCQILGRRISRDELQRHLILGFQETLGWEIVPGSLTRDEILEAVELSQEKYGKDRWTLERGRPSGELY